MVACLTLCDSRSGDHKNHAQIMSKDGQKRAGMGIPCPFKLLIRLQTQRSEKSGTRLRIQCPKGVQVQILFPARQTCVSRGIKRPRTERASPGG
jgi:hypothetical protein